MRSLQYQTVASTRSARKHWFMACTSVCALACLIATAAVLVEGGFHRAPVSDGSQYIGVADSLAAGRGYVWTGSLWGAAPHLGRLPLWPAVLAVFRWILPGATDGLVMRLAGIAVHALGAVLLMLVAYRLWPDLRIALLSGAAYACYPPALALLDIGCSEGIFVLTALAGIFLLLLKWPWQILGALVLGCSVLARSHVLLLPLLMIAVALWRERSLWRFWRRGLLLLPLFFLPPALWMLRNYAVSGAFPILTGMEGETLYGGNNGLVANDLQYWGYWVFPDLIPGETPKHILARHMSEADVNAYYRRRALAFIGQNATLLPRLAIGKLVRGFVPVPWVFHPTSLLASLARFLLYVGVLWALFRQPIQNPLLENPWFGAFVGALFLSTLITTLIFYGSFRISFCLESFLLPLAVAHLVRLWDGRRVRIRDGQMTPHRGAVPAH